MQVTEVQIAVVDPSGMHYACDHTDSFEQKALQCHIGFGKDILLPPFGAEVFQRDGVSEMFRDEKGSTASRIIPLAPIPDRCHGVDTERP